MKIIKNKEAFETYRVYNFICSFLLEKAQGNKIKDLHTYAVRKTAQIVNKPISKVEALLKLIK